MTRGTWIMKTRAASGLCHWLLITEMCLTTWLDCCWFEQKAFKPSCVSVQLNWSICNENESLFISRLDFKNPSEFRGLGPVLFCTCDRDLIEQSILHMLLCICNPTFKAARLSTLSIHKGIVWLLLFNYCPSSLSWTICNKPFWEIQKHAI